jgi:hypothetical protein
MRRRGQRNVAFAGQQPGCRVKADPAGAGQVNLRPGVQVGEVVIGAGRAVERLQIRLELDQIAGDEARGEAEMRSDLNQQPAGVAAGPFPVLKVSSGVCTPGSMRMT